MKPFVFVMLGLVLIAMMLAVPIVTRGPSAPPDCVGRVVILKKPNGEPVECVCVRGVLESCFNPGP